MLAVAAGPSACDASGHGLQGGGAAAPARGEGHHAHAPRPLERGRARHRPRLLRHPAPLGRHLRRRPGLCARRRQGGGAPVRGQAPLLREAEVRWTERAHRRLRPRRLRGAERHAGPRGAAGADLLQLAGRGARPGLRAGPRPGAAPGAGAGAGGLGQRHPGHGAGRGRHGVRNRALCPLHQSGSTLGGRESARRAYCYLATGQ
mmetsp:Transcript_69816/g.204351  ORF Transcript_69816/g.204351 Transcript_69816/m.204351 type:complete len:204 (-) Transcript_69816:441-1052(-)